jgi:NAD-dependent protein deacetylase/lipoamidase
MTLAEYKAYSEIVKNLVQVLGFAGGLFLLYQWIYGRRDRATDVLVQLDGQFTTEEMVQGRQLVEDDEKWKRVRVVLLKEVAPEDAYGAGYQTSNVGTDRNEAKIVRIIDKLLRFCGMREVKQVPDSEIVRIIDKLLRFYVLLCGVREAKQVPDSALRACFSYWLAHYYSPNRRELRLYVDTFYPTLSAWLKTDRHWIRRRFRRSFFGPERFGWNPNRPPNQQEIQRALQGRVLVITGAGISADSGIPTYRGKDGYWRNLNPKTLATLSAFERDPKLIWEWYCERRNLIRAATPNPAHRALARLTDCAQELLVVTQNVDDLHERAGLGRNRLVHIHGKIFDNKCTRCHFLNTDDVQPEPLPRCPECGALLRPGVVWFDEELYPNQVRRVDRFLERGRCDVVLVIGTTATFDYIVNWALKAVSPGGILLEVNRERTRLSVAADLSIRRKAAMAVPELIHTARR